MPLFISTCSNVSFIPRSRRLRSTDRKSPISAGARLSYWATRSIASAFRMFHHRRCILPFSRLTICTGTSTQSRGACCDRHLRRASCCSRAGYPSATETQPTVSALSQEVSPRSDSHGTLCRKLSSVLSALCFAAASMKPTWTRGELIRKQNHAHLIFSMQHRPRTAYCTPWPNNTTILN